MVEIAVVCHCLSIKIFWDASLISSHAMAQRRNSCELEAEDEALVVANTAHNEEICRAATFERLALGLAGVASRHTFIRDLLDEARPYTHKRGRDASFIVEDESRKRICTLGHVRRVGFFATSEVRLFASDEARDYDSRCSECPVDVTVRARLDDGPALISHITADLIQGMARQTVTGLESALDVVRSFLPATLADKLHAGGILFEEVACILQGVAAKLESMINLLHNRNSIGLLPGTLRVGKQCGPSLRRLKQMILLKLSATR